MTDTFRLQSSLNLYQEGIMRYTKVTFTENSLVTLLNIASGRGRITKLTFRANDLRSETGNLVINQLRATVNGGTPVDIIGASDSLQIYVGDGTGVTAQHCLQFDLNVPFSTSVLLEGNIQLGAGASNMIAYVGYELF